MKCNVCKKEGDEFEIIKHHLDYKSGKTILLCRKCHGQWHSKNKPIGNRKEEEMMSKLRRGNISEKEWSLWREWFHKKNEM